MFEQKILKVKKNNKKLEEFDKQKIINAIKNASESVKQDIPETTLSRIANDIYNNFYEQKDLNTVKVEDISKSVEDKLMASNYKDTARSYIKYHYDKEKERLANSEIIKQFKKKLDGVNIENQNANMDENTFSGRMQEASDIFLKEDALTNRMSKMARDNHLNNLIYVHDLGSYSSAMHNCLSIPFDNLLEKGFITKQTDIRSPRSVATALQLTAVLFQLQSLQQFGGVSATHLDFTMIPYIRYSFAKHYKDGIKYIKDEEWTTPKDEKVKNISIIDKDFYSDKKAYQYAYDLTKKEILQGCEGLLHNLNSLQSRSGAQLPFTSVNYGMCIEEEGRLFTDCLLEATLKGTGPLHKTSIFPCGIFQYHKEVNGKPNTPNYDLFKKALKCTSLRIYPNYANVEWRIDVNARNKDRDYKRKLISELSEADYNKLVEILKEKPEIARKLSIKIENRKLVVIDIPLPEEMFSTMGCRTANGYDINAEESIKKNIEALIKDKPLYDNVFSCIVKDGRGNLAPVTIILPSLAMLANKDVEKFMSLLEKKIHEAKDMLLERYELMCKQTPLAAPFMYSNMTMEGYIPEEGIKSALRHGTLAIGQLGLAETLELLVGCNQTKPLGMELAKRIEALYNKLCAQFKEEYKLNFSVYYTPAESLSYTAMKKFKAEYGEIKNVSDHEWFTNSIHIPVWENITPFEKIDLESQLTGYSNGGCITYVEIENATSNNIKAMEELVNYAMEKDIPYFALNTTLDCCNVCGYQGEIGKECPQCHTKDIDGNITRLRRVTGYITVDYHNFNLGKQKETENRVKHIGKIDC